MRYEIINPSMFPSLYLGYVDPTDYYSYTGIPLPEGGARLYQSLDELINHVHSRRSSLGYKPLEHLNETIQHYLFLVGDAPKSYFRKVPTSPEVHASEIEKIKTGAALAFSLSRAAISEYVTAGSAGWTTNKIAAERAEICYNCPKNKEVEKSTSQKVGEKILSVFNTARNTTYDEQLFDCEVCGCPMKEKVHYSEEIIVEVTPDTTPAKAFPESFIGERSSKRYRCWVREILSRREKGEHLDE